MTIICQAEKREQMKAQPQVENLRVDNLPTAVLSCILEFVGRRQYVYVAGVSRNFRDCYRDRFPEILTSLSAALESIPRAEILMIARENGSFKCSRQTVHSRNH